METKRRGFRNRSTAIDCAHERSALVAFFKSYASGLLFALLCALKQKKKNKSAKKASKVSHPERVCRDLCVCQFVRGF